MEVKALERDPTFGKLDFALGPFNVERLVGKRFFTPYLNSELAKRLPVMPTTARSPYDAQFMRDRSIDMSDAQRDAVLGFYGVGKQGADAGVTPAPPEPTSAAPSIGEGGGNSGSGGAKLSAMPPSPLAGGSTQMSSVTPANIKAPFYGGQAPFQAEMQKAQTYNQNNGIPSDQSRWNKSFPVVGGQNAAMGNLVGPGSYLPANNANKMLANPTVQQFQGQGKVNILPGQDQIQMSNVGAANVGTFNQQDLEANNLKPEEANSLVDPNFVLKHESYHAALENPALQGMDAKSNPTMVDPKSPIDGANVSHDVRPSEMRDYMSQLQEQQFRNTGHRFENGQDYENAVKSYNVTDPDSNKFEQGLQNLPLDDRRMYREMRKTYQTNPTYYQNIMEWQKKMIPGIVNNTPAAYGAISKVGEEALNLNKLAEEIKSLGIDNPHIDKLAKFNYKQDFKNTDFRKHPELYQKGKGEQGVLLVQPYKSEILPHWKFKTPDQAKVSADKIKAMHDAYKDTGDHVGVDMARKYLQMGWTRARRYANHSDGRKYDKTTREKLPNKPDESKAASAAIFREKLLQVLDKKAEHVPAKESDRNLLTDKTTGLSERLAHGKVDPREVLRELNEKLSKGGYNQKENDYMSGVKRQLIFREFARHALEQQRYKFPPGAKGKDSEEWKNLSSANTKIPIVDASVKDLQKGIPHNRARLLLARHAIRTQNIDPSLIAKWYKSNLKDYDPVINTYNIVQAASGITGSEPYYRKSNALTAGKKLDPHNEYTKGQGVDPTIDESTRVQLLEKIMAGNDEWSKRWKGYKEDRKKDEGTSLWPTKDKSKGKYFLADKDLKAKGHFGSFYKGYLKNEDELLKEAVATERKQFVQTLTKTRNPSAIIIKGNPKWLNGNHPAAKFYNEIANHLRKNNYSVTFDKGSRHTQPKEADLWIGHSRGVDRLRFAKKPTKTLDVTPYEHFISQMAMKRQDAIRKTYGVERVSDLPPQAQLRPPRQHYIFTPEMKQALDKVINEKRSKSR